MLYYYTVLMYLIIFVTQDKREKKTGEKEKVVRREFDRDADLKVNQFDEAMKKSVIKRSQQLGTRFETGASKFI